MHSCPRCGYECDCNGDIDDSHVMADAWVEKNCSCECEQYNGESSDLDPDFDEGDNAWMCSCGHYEESDFHCTFCGNEPPWGCDCPGCQHSSMADEDEFYFDDESDYPDDYEEEDNTLN